MLISRTCDWWILVNFSKHRKRLIMLSFNYLPTMERKASIIIPCYSLTDSPSHKPVNYKMMPN